MEEIDIAFLRLPPHDVNAEMATLGSLAIAENRSEVFFEIMAIVNGNDFYSADNQIVFESLVRMFKNGDPIDGLAFVADLDSRKLLDEIGGRDYIGKIFNAMPSCFHGAHYAKIVREKSLLRKAIAIGNDLVRDAYSPTLVGEAQTILTSGAKKCSEAAQAGCSSQSLTLGSVMLGVYEQLERGGVTLIPTGFTSLDEMIGGVALGEMIVVGARPSMGKSTLCRQLVEQISNTGVSVGFISLEESANKIGRNLLSSSSLIDNRRIRSGDIRNQQEWDQIRNGVASLSPLPVFINDRARRISDIRAVVSGWVARDGVKVVVIDYLQRIRGVPGKTSYEITSAISLEVSDLCKELQVGMIVVAQLNRGVENREDKRPNMADLRDSGQIEQDADGILLLHRPDYYGMNDPNYQPTHMAELIIAKWRDGVRGKIINLKTNLANQRFENLSAKEEQSASYDHQF